jgi:hypothetical protein
VVGDAIVYNAVSAKGDGKNDFFITQYMEVIPETQRNKVALYNRLAMWFSKLKITMIPIEVLLESVTTKKSW